METMNNALGISIAITIFMILLPAAWLVSTIIDGNYFRYRYRIVEYTARLSTFYKVQRRWLVFYTTCRTFVDFERARAFCNKELLNLKKKRKITYL